MAVAHVDVDTVIDQTGVDPKTAQRWINGRTPNARYRSKLAGLVGEEEIYLWPGLVDDDRARAASKSELVALYPRRADVPLNLWSALFRRTERAIDILAYAALFLHEQDPRLNELLEEKAAAGCEIRVAVGDPAGECVKTRGEDEQFGHGIASRCELALLHYRPLIGRERISVHMHDTTLYNSIFRFDDEVLVNAHLYATNAYVAPVLHLRRLDGGELFANYARSFEAVWDCSTPAA
ncbi:MAG: XRE family transcriptional regulator [Gaiellaceae bacterium]